MSPSASLLLALALAAALSPSDALLTPSTRRPPRYSSSKSYSMGWRNDDDPPLTPPSRPRSLRRPRIGSDFRQWQQQRRRDAPRSTTANNRSEIGPPPPRILPRRAMPHVSHVSHAEAATSAGYIVRRGDSTTSPKAPAGSNWRDLRQIGRTVRARPLWKIRRIVHRSQGTQIDRWGEMRFEALGGNKNSVDIHIRRSSSEDNWSRLLSSSRPQMDEFVDTSDRILPDSGDGRQRGGDARRVTFKATREASKPLTSKSTATLTEYMTQPVSQYSLLSFHDAEGGSMSGNIENIQQPMSRRWHVRRLTKEEARHYINLSASSSDEAEVMEESNLFRLAVPLLPLIGWDLTPVIDLEVIPPKNYISVSGRATDGPSSIQRDRTIGKTEAAYVIYETSGEGCDSESSSLSKWAPLRDIRKRMTHQGHGTKSDVANSTPTPPVVRIRSLRVSLLSTQREVKEVMSRGKTRRDKANHMGGSTMQREAIEMVGKVEEWLRPHITFEAELSWNDAVSSNGVPVYNDTPCSTVTVKSTAITSLTIPKIPSDIIRKSVPSEFLVKRLGATLTSRALAVCLPRFLNQLEKDYNRWSKE